MNEQQQDTRQEQTEGEKINQQGKRPTEVKFDIITNKWINLCAKTLSLDKLTSEISPIVPDLYNDNISGALAQGQTYMVQELKKAVNEEVKKTNLVEKMNTLDELIQEAKKRNPIEERFVPTPEQVMRGVSCKKKAKEAETLRVEYERIKNENTLLLERYTSLKNQLYEKKEHLTKDVEKYRNSISIANSIKEDQLTETLNKMDLLN